MKDILNTIFVGFFFIMHLIFAIFLFIPFGFLKLLKLEKMFNAFTHWVTSSWGRFLFRMNRSPMHVTGLENLPNHNRIIYIGNHQGYADIPFMMANLPATIGFIAKRELSRVPIIGVWMVAIHCILIDRGNFRKAMREIETGIAEADKGFPKVIFPEGTRSKGEKMGIFKPGSILLAAKAGLTIVPVTINGTWKMWEERKRIVPTNLELTIHPCIETKNMNENEQKQLTEKLRNIVAEALPNKGE
jgi:1-acyl-sn-glycerol-3-phosphate acyltransferase